MMYVLPHDHHSRPFLRQELTCDSYDSFKIFMGLPTTGGGPAAEKK